MHHPSIDEATGTACVNTFNLDSKSWGPTLGAANVIRTIHSALKEPSGESPLNQAAGNDMKKGYDVWKKAVEANIKKRGEIKAYGGGEK